MYNNVFCFSLSFSVFLVLLVCRFFSFFLLARFDELRPVLVASHCSLRSLANKLRSFVCTISAKSSHQVGDKPIADEKSGTANRNGKSVVLLHDAIIAEHGTCKTVPSPIRPSIRPPAFLPYSQTI